MARRRPWREDENAVLRAAYPVGGVEAVLAGLVGIGRTDRNRDAVQRQAGRLGVRCEGYPRPENERALAAWSALRTQARIVRGLAVAAREAVADLVRFTRDCEQQVLAEMPGPREEKGERLAAEDAVDAEAASPRISGIQE